MLRDALTQTGLASGIPQEKVKKIVDDRIRLAQTYDHHMDELIETLNTDAKTRLTSL